MQRCKMPYKGLPCLKKILSQAFQCVFYFLELMKKTSLSHWDIGGLLGGLQCNRMTRLAVRDVKAILCFCLGFQT